MTREYCRQTLHKRGRKSTHKGLDQVNPNIYERSMGAFTPFLTNHLFPSKYFFLLREERLLLLPNAVRFVVW